MAQSRYFPTAMRYSGLIVGCLATGMAYSMDAFNVYADSLKDLFQYSQSEVELIISLANLGLLSSLPTGLLMSLFGFRVLSFVSLVLSTGSYALLCMATYQVPYFSDKAFLIAIFFFLSGAGGGIMYITATTVNIRNFDMHHLGIVSGLLHSVKSAVLGVIMATYTVGYAGTSIKVALNSTLDDNTTTSPAHAQEMFIVHADLTGFFGVIAVSYAVVNVLGMIFYGSYPSRSKSLTETTLVFKPSTTRRTSSEKQPLISNPHRPDFERLNSKQEEDMVSQSSCSVKVIRSVSLRVSQVRYTLLDLIKSYYYHAALWPSAFLIAYRTCYINNLTSFTKSMHIDKYTEAVLLSIIPILGTAIKPVLGVLSDALSTRAPRSAGLLLFLLLDAAACLLCMTLFSEVGVITTGLVLALFGSCTVQTQSPAILVETFGKECFSYGWGFVTLTWCICTMGFQMVYGQLYDEKVLPDSGNYCYGQRCFTIYFAICGSLALLISVVMGYAVVKQVRELRTKNGMQSSLSVCE